MNKGKGSYWRAAAERVIRGVIEKQGTGDLDALEQAIRAAYPFGERKHWPYKVWLDAVNDTMSQLGRGKYVQHTPKSIKHWWVPEEEEDGGDTGK